MDTRIFKWVIWDKSDDLSIDYEVMSWGFVELPKTYVLNNNHLQDQSLTKETAYMCTAFANAEWANEINYKRWNNKLYEWLKLWAYMVSKKLLDPKKWAYIIDAVKSAKEMWMISWYTTVKTIEEIKDSIYKDRPVIVWTNLINRKETLKPPYIAIRWQSYWHAFFIAWYDEEKFICENSYWKLFDNWRFYIKYKDFDLLFNSKFSIFVDDDNFTKLNYFIWQAKKWWYRDFYDLHIKNKTWIDKMLATLANQLVFLKKVNNKELLDLIKK